MASATGVASSIGFVEFRYLDMGLTTKAGSDGAARIGDADAFAREGMHAINSPLGAMLMSAELADLYLRMNRVADARAAIAKLVGAGERCARTLRDYFEAAAAFEPGLLAEHSVDSLLAGLHRPADPWPAIVCTGGGELRLWLDALLAKKALRCMLINAADHGATCVTVSARQDGDTVVLDIRDNGSGIASEELRRVFDPFVSTNGASHTGLGLFMTRRIVTNLGGDISAVACRTGARFVVRLPCAGQAGDVSAVPISGNDDSGI
jgi:signal transduction histidine kinase